MNKAVKIVIFVIIAIIAFIAGCYAALFFGITFLPETNYEESIPYLLISGVVFSVIAGSLTYKLMFKRI